jgi:protein-disulfide isomerase
MSRTKTAALLIAALAAASAWATGCRMPTEPFDQPDGSDFDASADDDAGAGALCPPGTEDLFNSAYSPFMGGEESVDLVVVDYSWFKCPHCAHFADVWEGVWADRPDIRERVRLYFHHYPFSDAASWEIHSATVAAANQGMENFWAVHDYIFTGLYDDGVHVSIDDIRTFCDDVLGLDMAKFEEDLADPYTQEFLAWDKEQAQAAGVTGTPSVFVCGEKISWGSIEGVIDSYLDGE